MALNLRNFLEGIKIIPRASTTIDEQGELEVLSSNGKLQFHNGTSASPVVTAAHSETLTNKTIDADLNTISNIDNADIKAGAAIDRTKLASGTADHVIINNGSGVLSSEATLAKSRGGSGQDNSSLTFPASGTLATLAGIESFSNKKFTDSIQLEDPGAGTNKITIQAPTLAGDYTLTLPVDDGTSGQVLSTNGSGVLSWAAASTDPMTTAGDLIYRNGSNVTARLPIGAEGGILSVVSGAPAWFPVGTEGQLLTIVSGVPAWATDSGGGSNFSSTVVKTTNYTLVSGDANKVILCDTTGGGLAITLPTPSAGYFITIKDSGGAAASNPISIVRAGSEKIDNGSAGIQIDVANDSVSLISDGTDWFRVVSFSGPVVVAGRGVFGGGRDSTNAYVNTIDYISIVSTGNATDFGDLLTNGQGRAGVSSATRGCWGGRYDGTYYPDIDYITIATTGNASDFGDLSVTRSYTGGCGSSTRGLFGGGWSGSGHNVIDYITIATLGNAVDFGDLTVTRYGVQSCSSSTRGLFGGGDSGTESNVIDYVTIASTGNATDFGDLTVARFDSEGASSSTRGLFMGGEVSAGTFKNEIDYVTIASIGNATDFGDLSVTRGRCGCTSNGIRAVAAGGFSSGSTYHNVIDYVTIASAANATDFGDLTTIRSHTGGLSDSHGGL